MNYTNKLLSITFTLLDVLAHKYRELKKQEALDKVCDLRDNLMKAFARTFAEIPLVHPLKLPAEEVVNFDSFDMHEMQVVDATTHSDQFDVDL